MRKHHFATPADAEAAFYDALERGDLEDLMAVWCTQEDVVCIHPGGSRLDGYEVVREGWRMILEQSRLRVRTSDTRAYDGLSYAVHTLCEWVSEASRPADATPVFATNAYLLTDKGWRMVLHHASAAPTASLEEDDHTPEPGTLLH